MVSNVERLRQRWAEQDEYEIDQAISALLQHRQGRRLLWWMLQIGRWGTQPYARNALDTSFACGELNVGQKLMDRILEVDPSGFVAMMEENANERNTRDIELGNAADADARSERGEPEPDA